MHKYRLVYISLYIGTSENSILVRTSYSPAPWFKRRCGNIVTDAFYVTHNPKFINENCFTLVLVIRNTSRDRKMHSSIRKICAPRNIRHYLLLMSFAKQVH